MLDPACLLAPDRALADEAALARLGRQVAWNRLDA